MAANVGINSASITTLVVAGAVLLRAYYPITTTHRAELNEGLVSQVENLATRTDALMMKIRDHALKTLGEKTYDESLRAARLMFGPDRSEAEFHEGNPFVRTVKALATILGEDGCIEAFFTDAKFGNAIKEEAFALRAKLITLCIAVADAPDFRIASAPRDGVSGGGAACAPVASQSNAAEES